MAPFLRVCHIRAFAIVAGVAATAIVGTVVETQQPQADPLINENAIAKVSDHVHAQTGFQAAYPEWAAAARVGLIARTAHQEAP